MGWWKKEASRVSACVVRLHQGGGSDTDHSQAVSTKHGGPGAMCDARFFIFPFPLHFRRVCGVPFVLREACPVRDS